jgi:hypothetical protein
MVAGDKFSIRGQVMEYMYIPTGIKRELVRSGVDCYWKRQVIGTVGRRPVAIHSSGQTIFSLAHIEGITLGAGEEVDEVAGGASGMSVDGIGEVGDRASEGQAAEVYGTGFTVESQAGKGARGKTRGWGTRSVLTRS